MGDGDVVRWWNGADERRGWRWSGGVKVSGWFGGGHHPWRIGLDECKGRGGGRWSVGGSGRQVVDVLVQLAKRFLRAVMARSWVSRDEAGASAIAEDR